MDGYVYFSQYSNFLGQVAIGQSMTGNPTGINNPATTRNVSYAQNTEQDVKAIGWGLTAEYKLPHNLFFYGNVYSDKLRDVPQGYATFFNAPLYRFNLGLRSENLYRNVGFNVVYKWQDENFYEGTFVTGTLPSFGWLDAQVSYKIPNTKSLVRIGGTNIANNYQRTGYGSPYVGGLYYVSYGYNIF